MAGATPTGETYDLVVVGGGFAGVIGAYTFLKNTKSYRRALREVEYGPLNDAEFLKSISPMTYLDRIKTPLLNITGDQDPNVPASQSREMYYAMRRLGKEVEWVRFVNGGPQGRPELHTELFL